MTARALFPAADPADARRAPRQSKKVAWVAHELDMHSSGVRKLIATGKLEAHGVGTRAVRVYLDSVADYQDSQNKVPGASPRPVIHKKKPASASTASFRAAMTGLQSKGLA